VQATSGVADHEQGLASGLLNTAMQIGGAVVLAVVTAILTSSGKGKQIAAGHLLPGMMPALAVVVGVSVAGLLYTLIRVRADRPAAPQQAEFALAD
jgi:sugar phosphate permease